jgi:hypothetical protein
MTARISLILGKSGAHRAPLSCLSSIYLFTAPLTARFSFRFEVVSNVSEKRAVIDRAYSLGVILNSMTSGSLKFYRLARGPKQRQRETAEW